MSDGNPPNCEVHGCDPEGQLDVDSGRLQWANSGHSRRRGGMGQIEPERLCKPL